MRALVTGAAGRVGSAFMASRPPTGWELVGTDSEAGQRLQQLDVTDVAACREAVTGMQAVVHLAADPSPDADFRSSVLPLNIVGTYNMVEAAAQAGVPRFVFASSVQAVEGYPRDVQVRETDAPRPRNDYGVGKAFGEALCAAAAQRSQTVFVSVRIGNFSEERPAADGSSLRGRMTWLSPRDAAQLLWRAVTAPLDRHHVLHGLSDNAAKRLSIAATRRLTGYDPVDDAFA